MWPFGWPTKESLKSFSGMVSWWGQLERRAQMWETAFGGTSWFWRSPPPDFWRVCRRPGDISLFFCYLNDWTGGLDERLCPCYGEDGGQRLRKPCGCSWLHHWGMRMFISLMTWQRFSGRLSLPIWNPWEHCLVLLQTWSSWLWPCLCNQSW